MLGWWLPESISTYGSGPFHFLYWGSGIALLIAQARLSRFRRGISSQGHPMLEVVWAIVPALILVWLGLLSHRPSNEFSGTRQQIARDTSAVASPLLSEASHPFDGTVR